MRASGIATLLAAVAALAFALRVPPYQLDDAYITYGYAISLLEGYGFVFQPGAAVAEGISSPLWLAALVAAGAILGTDALPAVASFLGCAGLVAALALLVRIDSGGRLVSALPALVLAVSAPAAYYATTGLETWVFAALVLAVAVAAVGGLPLAVGVATAAVAPWARPEGPWLLVMLGAVAALQRDRAALRRAVVLAIAVSAGTGSLLVARGAIFGTLLPLTYHAKPAVLGDGMVYALRGLANPWAATLLALAVVGAWVGDARHRGLLAAAATWALAAVLEGGDWMPAGRLLLPCYALLAAAASGALPGVLRAARERGAAGSPRVDWRVVAVSVLAASAIGAGAFGAADSVTLADRTRRTLRHEEQRIEAWLTDAGVPSVALVDIGQLRVRTELEVLDLGGLTDPRIGGSPGPRLDKAFDLDYLFAERRPAAVVVRVERAPDVDGECRGSVDASTAIAGTERRVLGDPRWTSTYELVRSVVPEYGRTPFYGRLIFLRREFASDVADSGCRIALEPLPR